MARDRRSLHEKLVAIVPANTPVYFQPPRSMTYPCLRYSKQGSSGSNGSRFNGGLQHANNSIYRKLTRYELIWISQDPDSNVGDRLRSELEYCAFDRVYTVDNLIHEVFVVYY